MQATDTRSRIFARIREALREPAPMRHLTPHPPAEAHDSHAESSSDWLPAVPSDPAGQLDLFLSNAAALKCEVVLCDSAEAAAESLKKLAADSAWKRVAAHRFAIGDAVTNSLGLPVTWVDGGYQVSDLESANAAISGCECLVSQTGSILVSAAASGGRALSVLPPHHIVVASRQQIVPDLSAALTLVRERNGGEPPAFLSFVTGPSRTGDIERILVLGAHGPKRLTILLLP